MPRAILAMFFVLALSACGMFHRARVASVPAPQPVAAVFTPPKLAQGLWAILDPGCPKPEATNIHLWPACASPVWINRDKAVVIRSDLRPQRTLGEASFEADLSFAPGDPLIAQVGTEKDGYMFLALTHLAKDDQGRLVGAVGAAVSCPKAQEGALVIKPNLTGCESESLDDVRRAAMATLQDHAALTEVAWIAPGAPAP